MPFLFNLVENNPRNSQLVFIYSHKEMSIKILKLLKWSYLSLSKDLVDSARAFIFHFLKWKCVLQASTYLKNHQYAIMWENILIPTFCLIEKIGTLPSNYLTHFYNSFILHVFVFTKIENGFAYLKERR